MRHACIRFATPHPPAGTLMALNALSPGIRTLLSILATAAALFSGLLFLASFLMSSAFAGDVPSGSDAMGLVVPLLASVVAGLLLLLATWLVAANGRLAWAGAHAGIIGSAVMLGVAFAAVAMLVAWMERMGAWVMPVGVFCGGLAPAFAVVLLLRCAWTTPDNLQSAAWPKWLAAPLLLAALCGMGLAIWGAVTYVRSEIEATEQAAAERAASAAEEVRLAALSPVQRMREDYADMSADAPLWSISAGLPEVTDMEVRDFIVARALQVPDLDADLERTISSEHPRYRHAALMVIQHAPAESLRPAWAAMVARSIEVTAQQVIDQAEWLQPDDFSNPDPVAHIAALVAASKRFEDQADVAAALTRLGAALQALPPGTQRDAALAAMDMD
jgi:hypothetical protein